MVQRHPLLMHMYELTKVVEVDMDLGFDSFSIRIELFRNMNSPRWFRARMWSTEYFRIQPTFPQNEHTGKPAHKPSDELVQIRWEGSLSQDYSRFQASSADAAMHIIIDDIKQFMERFAATGGEQQNE